MEAPNKAFGERLREAREARGLTQVQLAQELGVPQKQISAWEAGAHKPATLDRLSRLAKAVGTTIDWLVDGKGKPPKRHFTVEADEGSGGTVTQRKRKGG